MNSSAFFISDAHLGINPPNAVPNREEVLIKLLYSWKSVASHVFIVGDLFEFWYEYQYYVDNSHFKLFSALASLVESGVQVHVFCGNHDFAYGDFFQKNLGVQVHKDFLTEIQGRKIFLKHGDGVAKSDFGYRFFRKVLDFPLNRWLFKQIHPDWGMELAHFVGRNSRKHGENKDIQINEYLEWGNSVIKEKKCDFCIHGHHHIPGIWTVENGVVASPGEWIKKLTYLQLEDGELKLKSL